MKFSFPFEIKRARDLGTGEIGFSNLESDVFLIGLAPSQREIDTKTTVLLEIGNHPDGGKYFQVRHFPPQHLVRFAMSFGHDWILDVHPSQWKQWRGFENGRLVAGPNGTYIMANYAETFRQECFIKLEDFSVTPNYPEDLNYAATSWKIELCDGDQREPLVSIA